MVWSTPPNLGHAETIEKGHGRIETRQIETTASLSPLLAADWAGAAQVCRITRMHWGIENKLHYVRDVTCREDQAHTHAGHASQVLAACSNTAPTIIRRLGYKVVEGFEYFAEHRLAAVAAVRGLRTE